MTIATQAERPLAIVGATVIDGNGGVPIIEGVVIVRGERVAAVGDRSLPVPPNARVISAAGKYVIPGLMNANVHLLLDIRLEVLARHEGRYEDLIVESAQVALRNGLTTVFDTWGPREPLKASQARIQSGQDVGARIFLAGNIVGLDGPISQDFVSNAVGVATPAFTNRINALWTENTGRHLMWLTPEALAQQVRAYIGRGIDFLKYASNDHAPGAFLAFSPTCQTEIVKAAHDAGLTAQAHTMSVEGLRVAVEAGCDLIQHANITGPVQIPPSTLELLAARRTSAVVFPFTKVALDWIGQNTSEMERTVWAASDANVRSLIGCDVPLLLANDGALFSADSLADTAAKSWMTLPQADSLASLAEGHFNWLRAMQEKGMAPMKILMAATKNVATAYGKDRELGSISVGRLADLVILDRNPLEDAQNYRAIHSILKEGVEVKRDALPTTPILTRSPLSASDQERISVPFLGGRMFPGCPACSRGIHASTYSARLGK